MVDAVLDLFSGREGHFRYESGHHGDLWLDLELLFLNPGRIRPFAQSLAERLRPYPIEIVCGPLIEGAFVAQLVAEELGCLFCYTEPGTDQHASGLFPVCYHLPPPLYEQIRGRKVAVVNDAINAGSAVRGTIEELRAFGATPIVIGALLVLGASATTIARQHGLKLEALATRQHNLWPPDACPLCVKGTPLDNAPPSP